MQDEIPNNNRQYLAFILAGGPSKDPFRSITCAVDAAGQIVFFRVLERYGDTGGGYDIQITGPGGRFEIWMGEGRECVAIKFEARNPDTNADPVPALPVGPVEVLEALRRWKAAPGVRETIANAGGAIVREYWPAPDKEQPAPAGQ